MDRSLKILVTAVLAGSLARVAVAGVGFGPMEPGCEFSSLSDDGIPMIGLDHPLLAPVRANDPRVLMYGWGGHDRSYLEIVLPQGAEELAGNRHPCGKDRRLTIRKAELAKMGYVLQSGDTPTIISISDLQKYSQGTSVIREFQYTAVSGEKARNLIIDAARQLIEHELDVADRVSRKVRDLPSKGTFIPSPTYKMFD